MIPWSRWVLLWEWLVRLLATVEDCLWACRRERLRRRGKEVASEIDRLQKAATEHGWALLIDDPGEEEHGDGSAKHRDLPS